MLRQASQELDVARPMAQAANMSRLVVVSRRDC